MNINFWLRIYSFTLAFISTSVWAQQSDIKLFETIHGTVSHQESTEGRSYLKFIQKGNLVPLPSEWKNVSVEEVVNLNGQTVIVMSHAQGKCGSRMSLAVVAPNVFWGPYALGDCEDVIIHQKSEDGKSFIAIRSDKSGGRAWVYASQDESFRGPVKVKLPASMAMMVPNEETAKQKPVSVPQASSVKSKTPGGTVRPQDSLGDQEELVISSTPSPKLPFSTVSSKPQGSPVSSIPAASAKTASTTLPAPVPTLTKPVTVLPTVGLSPGDATKMAEEAKRTTPAQRPKIMISL